MQDFRKLEVWQHAHRLTLDAYRICGPRFRRFPGLRSQTLRAAQSIGSNIAEGSGAERAEFVRFLKMALRSTLEVENDVLLARDLGALELADYANLDGQVDRLRRKLISLIRTIQRS